MFETSFDVVEISVVGVDRVTEERERMGTFLEFGAQEDPIKANVYCMYAVLDFLMCLYICNCKAKSKEWSLPLQSYVLMSSVHLKVTTIDTMWLNEVLLESPNFLSSQLRGCRVASSSKILQGSANVLLRYRRRGNGAQEATHATH